MIRLKIVLLFSLFSAALFGMGFLGGTISVLQQPQGKVIFGKPEIVPKPQADNRWHLAPYNKPSKIIPPNYPDEPIYKMSGAEYHGLHVVRAERKHLKEAALKDIAEYNRLVYNHFGNTILDKNLDMCMPQITKKQNLDTTMYMLFSEGVIELKKKHKSKTREIMYTTPASMIMLLGLRKIQSTNCTFVPKGHQAM